MAKKVKFNIRLNVDGQAKVTANVEELKTAINGGRTRREACKGGMPISITARVLPIGGEGRQQDITARVLPIGGEGRQQDCRGVLEMSNC